VKVRCPDCGRIFDALAGSPQRRAMLTPEGRFLGEYDAARQVVILRYRGQDYEFHLLECDRWRSTRAPSP